MRGSKVPIALLLLLLLLLPTSIFPFNMVTSIFFLRAREIRFVCGRQQPASRAWPRKKCAFSKGEKNRQSRSDSWLLSFSPFRLHSVYMYACIRSVSSHDKILKPLDFRRFVPTRRATGGLRCFFFYYFMEI